MTELEKLWEKVDKVFSRMFESNGDPSIIQELKDKDQDILDTRNTANKALELADKTRKYCGLSDNYDPKEVGGKCIMAEITLSWKSFKKTAMFWGIVLLVIFLSSFIISAYNGWDNSKKMTNVVKELIELKKAAGITEP